VQSNSEIKNEVGGLSDSRLLPLWGTGIGTDPEDDSLDYATITMIVKGNKKYKEVSVYLEKKSGDAVWTVDTNRINLDVSSAKNKSEFLNW
jgi:hypothetical protein